MFLSGSTKCIWYVQKFELFSNANYEKRWSSHDLLLFGSYDPKQNVSTYPSDSQGSTDGLRSMDKKRSLHSMVTLITVIGGFCLGLFIYSLWRAVKEKDYSTSMFVACLTPRYIHVARYPYGFGNCGP
ncbi:uncharacterized protein LOC131243154 isoform X3 [Magnolia sinica]|uniref:uncharacterized protein LOC131243154 isoform X3 n=1 Tax=Magnolia sinica TaxID=86752 RepID=UPI0026596B62|nr:uncharacterized protein LOC131243154 isoform X3 [Magnolia sinica]